MECGEVVGMEWRRREEVPGECSDGGVSDVAV